LEILRGGLVGRDAISREIGREKVKGSLKKTRYRRKQLQLPRFGLAASVRRRPKNIR